MDFIDLKGKKVLVTGASGYLGSRLIQKLLKIEANVYSIDVQSKICHPKESYYKINLNDSVLLNETISEIKPDVIYHLAASLDRTRDFSKTNTIMQTNLLGTVNLLNALKEINYNNFIFVSTSEIYGGDSIITPINEDSVFVPASPYSLSKYCAEMAVKTYSNLHKKNFTILRVFNFFGNNMSESFFLPQLVNKLKSNQDFDMTNGEQKRDFLIIDDVIEALILSFQKKAYNQVFNVCSGQGRPIRELALQFKTQLKSESNINFGAIQYRNNEVWDLTGDNSKIKQILGWRPSLDIFSII